MEGRKHYFTYVIISCLKKLRSNRSQTLIRNSIPSKGICFVADFYNFKRDIAENAKWWCIKNFVTLQSLTTLSTTSLYDNKYILIYLQLNSSLHLLHVIYSMKPHLIAKYNIIFIIFVIT